MTILLKSMVLLIYTSWRIAIERATYSLVKMQVGLKVKLYKTIEKAAVVTLYAIQTSSEWDCANC